MTEKRYTLCPEELRDVIRETVHETLTGMGLSVDNPLEAQEDFLFLRDFRKTMRSVRQKVLMLVVGAVVTGLVAAVWVGIKTFTAKP